MGNSVRALERSLCFRVGVPPAIFRRRFIEIAARSREKVLFWSKHAHYAEGLEAGTEVRRSDEARYQQDSSGQEIQAGLHTEPTGQRKET